VSGLTGFSDGSTYVLFDVDEEGEAWDKLLETLDENSIELQSGSWSQLG
jgi:hypothetical protein